jgi:hypothetical protein
VLPAAYGTQSERLQLRLRGGGTCLGPALPVQRNRVSSDNVPVEEPAVDQSNESSYKMQCTEVKGNSIYCTLL